MTLDRGTLNTALDNPRVIDGIGGGAGVSYGGENLSRADPISVGRAIEGAKSVRSSRMGDGLSRYDESRMSRATE